MYLKFKKWSKTEKIMTVLLAIIPILGLTVILFFWYDTLPLLVGIGITGIGILLLCDLMFNVIGIERGNVQNDVRVMTSHHSLFLSRYSQISLEEKQVLSN